jgi:signal transduction histidine kinase
LGLPIVKRVVDLYGGQLQVQSELGVGTKFTFILPAFEATGHPEARASTILAVE